LFKICLREYEKMIFESLQGLKELSNVSKLGDDLWSESLIIKTIEL